MKTLKKIMLSNLSIKLKNIKKIHKVDKLNNNVKKYFQNKIKKKGEKMKKIIIGLGIILGVIISIFLVLVLKILFFSILLSINIETNFGNNRAKKQVIKSLYNNRNIVLNPDEIKVEVENTIAFKRYTYYIKNKYGEDIKFTEIDKNLDFLDDNEFAYFIIITKISPYLEQKYKFLNEEKEALEKNLKEYKHDYEIKIEPSIVYEYDNKLISDDYNKVIEEIKGLYYIDIDSESYDVLHKIIPRNKKIKNLNFNEINPEEILNGIDRPAILITVDEKKVSKEELIKLNAFIQKKKNKKYMIVYSRD